MTKKSSKKSSKSVAAPKAVLETVASLTTSLTELERTALADLWASSAGSGHDFGFPDELPSIPKASRGGVVASLQEKGIIDVHKGSGPDRKTATQFTFTEGGKSLFGDFQKSPDLKEKTMAKTATSTAAPKKPAAPKASPKKSPAAAAPTEGGTPGAKKKDGLRNPQIRILQCLAKLDKAMTRAELSEKAPVDVATCVEYLGSHDPDKRAANDAKHFPSLLTLGYVKLEEHDVDGKNVRMYAITANGRKAVAKL